MLQNNNIVLNNDSFDNFSKKLYVELEKQSELSLSKTREIASKSLGFRNYHAIKTYLNLSIIEKKQNSSSQKSDIVENNHFLKRFTNDNIISIVSVMIKVDDMWGERALILLKTVLSLLDAVNIEKNADNIREYILFDRLFAFYKSTDNEKAKNIIETYCTNMLPGFDKDRYDSTASSQNSYLSVQILPVIEFFKQVENHDFLMFSLDWLTTAKDERLDIKSLTNFFKLYKKKSSISGDWDTFLSSDEDHNANLKFNPDLVISEAYQDSWFCDEAFISIMTSKLMSLKYEKFYFSDFLYNVSKVINTEKKKTYIKLLENIKHNYESCIQYSEQLYDIANYNK